MIAEQVFDSDDFKKCEQFHGHVCPGLAIGYQASKAALAWLEENRSADEEIVAIVENDACCVDAIQVMTGCTFGKGNFIFKDHGKMVFTFLSRNSGKGIRLSMKPGVLEHDDRHRQLMEKVRENKATDQELKEFAQLHHQRTTNILNTSTDNLFNRETATCDIPPKAVMLQSEPCKTCGEPTMSSKLELVNGNRVCRDCSAKTGSQ